MTREASPDPLEIAPRAGWRPIERLALPAGWVATVVARGPALIAAAPADRGAPAILLCAMLLWWIAVVAVVRSDLARFIIPDEASLAIAGLGLAVAAGGPWLAGEGGASAGAAGLAALSTGAAAFAIFQLVGLAFRRFGRDALGFGDVKLAGACAVWLDPGDAALALEIAALGAIAALLLGRRGGTLRDTAVPFGAFLAPAAWLVAVVAQPLRDAAGSVPW